MSDNHQLTISPNSPNTRKNPCADQEAAFPTAHSHPVSVGTIHVPKKAKQKERRMLQRLSLSIIL
eukprot:12285284-Ditylum_brightwellii.AAC.1